MSSHPQHPAHDTPASHSGGFDPALVYATTEDSRTGLAVGAMVALALHAAVLAPVLLREISRDAVAALAKESTQTTPRSLSESLQTPRPLVTPAPRPIEEKITAPEGDVTGLAAAIKSADVPPSKQAAPLIRRTPAPPPPPTTAPAGMDKASAVTMAWISAEAFEAMVAQQGRVEQAGFQRTATPVPGAPMRTDPIPLAAKAEVAGGEVAMQGAPGRAAPETPPANVAQPAAKPIDDTKGPPPAKGIGGDRVVQMEGPANDLPMKTSTPQGTTWEEPAVKTGPLVMGEVLPGQGKPSEKESSAAKVGLQRGHIEAAPSPTLKEAPAPTVEGKGTLSPGLVEAQPAIKEVAVSPAQPSVAPPTVVGKPVVPLKSDAAGQRVPLGDSQAATEVVSNQQGQRVGDRAQQATRETLPQVGQEAREARPLPTGTEKDVKNPPRAGIAEDAMVEGARSAPSATLADKITATGGKDDHTAGEGALALVVPNPAIDDAAPARTAPDRPGIGNDRPDKPSDKSPDPNAKTAAPKTENNAAPQPTPQAGRPAATPQGAEHGGEKPRVSSLPRSDRESPPVSLSPEPIKLRPGAVLVGEGIEIRTVMPRLSVVAQVTSLPANPEVKVTFSRSGKVINAEVIRSTGYPNWDGPILSSLYLWTVRGERFERVNGPVEFKFVILITD